MKITVFSPVIFLIFITFATQKGFDKATYYNALSSNSEEQVDNEITKVDDEGESSLFDAYMGTLLMRKAGFEKGPPNKLKTFKKGTKLLEKEIRNDPKNAEYRFLRLIIQENAPKILGYNKNLNEDKQLILDEYDKSEPELKKIIKNYSANSRIIKTNDLK